MNNNITEITRILQNKTSEVYHIEGALNNLKVVLFLQSNEKNACLTVSPTTNKMIVDLFTRQQDLQIEIASYEREIKRLKQQDNDQIAVSMGYL